jgi:hypothetical protein
MASKGYRDGYSGKDKSPPNKGLDYTFTSPVGKGPGTSNELNEENKEYSSDYNQGKSDAARDSK